MKIFNRYHTYKINLYLIKKKTNKLNIVVRIFLYNNFIFFLRYLINKIIFNKTKI